MNPEASTQDILERALQKEVERVLLNDLLPRHPDLAYQVVASGRLITCRNREAYVRFKTRAILEYLDTAYLREMVNRAFLERVRNDRFGERPDARPTQET